MNDDATLVKRAEQIAKRAHAGQTDKSGNPYIGHLSRVAAGVDEPDAEAVAWLHDAVEDTEISLEDLRRQGIPERIVTAVDAITRRPAPDDDYPYRVKQNRLALKVKAADIADNANPDRLAQLDPDTRARLEDKYANLRDVLGLQQ